jgi:glycosyltransferase involved in cell wall biosynthesis
MEVLQNIRRLRIGIIFNFSPKWMGGIIYILNLIKTLDFLNDEDKPNIILFYRTDLRKFVDEINYTYLKVVEWQFPPVNKSYLLSWLYRKNIFVSEILKLYDLDGLYPLNDYPVKTKTGTKLVSWFADFQHKHYPEFFTRRKIFERNVRIRLMKTNTRDMVVSSQTVADDFERFYKLHKSLKLHIFHFVSVVDSIDGIDIEELKFKYQLPDKYFMISNQFLKHKNHKILFQAIALIKQKGATVHLALTGKLPENSHSPYITELYRLIEENQLQNQISFLEVIPRKEQLILMKNSQAVIQPSLFEGWSTVIEDAKSLQVPLIASNLPVNIEQLGQFGLYFDPFKPEELASILIDFPQRNLRDIFYDDYSLRIKQAAEVFIKVFS